MVGGRNEVSEWTIRKRRFTCIPDETDLLEQRGKVFRGLYLASGKRPYGVLVTSMTVVVAAIVFHICRGCWFSIMRGVKIYLKRYGGTFPSGLLRAWSRGAFLWGMLGFPTFLGKRVHWGKYREQTRRYNSALASLQKEIIICLREVRRVIISVDVFPSWRWCRRGTPSCYACW